MDRLIAFALAALMTSWSIGCAPPPPPPAVKVLVVSKALNANGFKISLAYESTGKILAHVEEKQELIDPDTGGVKRTITLEYWEWFTTTLVPPTISNMLGTIPQPQWNVISSQRGKKIFMDDRIQTGPFLVTGFGHPNKFQVKITRKHTLYTGSHLRGINPPFGGLGGKAGDFGRFGFFKKGPNGVKPSMTMTVLGPPVVNTDLTNNWIASQTINQGHKIRGRVVKVGKVQAVIEIKYDGGWQKDTDPAAPPGTFGVDWRIELDITGAAQEVVTGHDSGKKPSDKP